MRARKQIALLVSVLFFVAMLAPYAQARDSACRNGDKDAQEMENSMKFVFFGGGCLLGPIGLLLGFFVIPPAPEKALMGKTSEYVSAYMKCYNETAVETQGMASMMGCGGFMLIGWGLFMWFAVISPFLSHM